MGLDADIYFRSTQPGEPELAGELPAGCKVAPRPRWAPKGATHHVEPYTRLYREDYERGNWPRLCAVLLVLHATLGIDEVWYGCSLDYDPVTLCPPDRLQELSAHWIEHGNGPWEESRDEANRMLKRTQNPE